jgi:hypothetical protein
MESGLGSGLESDAESVIESGQRRDQ